MARFERISVKGWRQFKSVDIEFHPRLTIITGANGAGKSTILSLLSRHFGYNRPFLSTPIRGSKTGIIQYFVGFFHALKERHRPLENEQRVVGRIEYSDGSVSNLFVPKANSLSYDVSIPSIQPIEGLHIDSHRPPSMYRHVSSIPTTPATIEDLVNGFSHEMRHYYSSGGSQQGSLFHLKSALINMAIFGYGNEASPRNEILVRIYEGFQDKLREVLPSSVGFKRFYLSSPEIILETSSGDFVIDSASGGIIKLIEITWQLYSFSISQKRFVATIDEPENHLHPSMQRTFLTNLVQAFPNVQFVVVTHSPFVVSSVKDSNVVVLQYEDAPFVSEEPLSETQRSRPDSGLRVVSLALDTVNKAGTAQDILREALGVPTTIPDWAEERLQTVLADYRAQPITEVTLKEMYEQLEREGLVSEYPAAVQDLVSRQ